MYGELKKVGNIKIINYYEFTNEELLKTIIDTLWSKNGVCQSDCSTVYLCESILLTRMNSTENSKENIEPEQN